MILLCTSAQQRLLVAEEVQEVGHVSAHKLELLKAVKRWWICLFGLNRLVSTVAKLDLGRNFFNTSFKDCAFKRIYTQSNLKDFLEDRRWVSQQVFVANEIDWDLISQSFCDEFMAFSNILTLNWNPFVPPVWVVFTVVSYELKSIMGGKKILAVSHLMNRIWWIPRNDNHFLCVESLRLTIHGVTCLREPDATFSACMQLAQITTSNGLIKSLVNVCVRSNEQSGHLFKHPSKCRVASLVKWLDRNLVEPYT